MRLSSIHQIGLFHQKLRAATSLQEELEALNQYKKNMDDIENDLLMERYKGGIVHGKAAAPTTAS